MGRAGRRTHRQDLLLERPVIGDLLEASTAFFIVLKWKEEEEEEEEEEADASDLLSSSSWPLSTAAVACSPCCFAGSYAPRDVFPMADDWSILLGNMAGMDQKDSIFVGVMAVAYARLVFLVSLFPLCSLLSWSGPDAPHHGRYQPEGLSFSGLVLLVILHRPLMLVGRPAGRSASWPVWTRRTVMCCAENCGKSAVAVHQQGRLPPLRGAQNDRYRMVETFRKLWSLRSWCCSWTRLLT